jgi:glycine C-acetyltransferase
MYSDSVRDSIRKELGEMHEAGLLKRERIIESPQSAEITVKGKKLINMCANNYLGLSNDSRIKAAAQRGIEEYGLGLSSVRFICGTQTIHKNLEKQVSNFLGTEDTILYNSCFDANGGLFETILGEKDAIISDSLNHASIIDGIRLCKAERLRYTHGDLNELETHLKTATEKGCRRIMVATDGVFSMDGDVADLQQICSLAEKYGAMVMVDDSHATGFFGRTGRGSIEHCDVMKRVDIVTSTMGKALGGGCGGFTTGKQEIIDMLRQRSRPYLFSNSLPPAIVAATTECLNIISKDNSLCEKLQANTAYFRAEISKIGYNVRPGIHPIVPVMLGDARLASQLADALLNEGIYVVGFSYPVVPQGKARIRVQVSAAHSREQLTMAVEAFKRAGKMFGIGSL